MLQDSYPDVTKCFRIGVAKMSFSEIRVLICDDSILVRKKMTNLITKLGCKEIYTAVDGEQAVEQYKAYLPDITFMDIVMPKKTGVEALKEIKNINPKAKVVMASSVGTQANLKEAIEAGVYDFLQKPITDSDIEKILSRL